MPFKVFYQPTPKMWAKRLYPQRGNMNSMQVTITHEDPENADSVMLISELDAYLIPLYPPESCHGYSPKQLAKENVAFFILWLNKEPAACGAVKLFDRGYAEIKRVYVRPRFRRKGLGKIIVKHLENHAAQEGAKLIRLESGVNQPEALALYEHMKYKRTTAFPPYLEDPLSVFYEKSIEPKASRFARVARLQCLKPLGGARILLQSLSPRSSCQPCLR